MALKSRKELRLAHESAAAELAELKTPEGVARYLLSMREDEDFMQRFQNFVMPAETPTEQEPQPTPAETPTEQEPEPTPAETPESELESAGLAPPNGGVEPRFRLMRVHADGRREMIGSGMSPFPDDMLDAIAAELGVPRTDLQVDEHEV